MSDKRVTVWVQRFKDRPHLMLQWIDPDPAAARASRPGPPTAARPSGGGPTTSVS